MKTMIMTRIMMPMIKPVKRTVAHQAVEPSAFYNQDHYHVCSEYFSR